MQVFVFGILTWVSFCNVHLWIDSIVIADDVFTSQADTTDGQSDLTTKSKELFMAISSVSEDRLTAPAASLGHDLFWDSRLSANGKIACASCHLPEKWGADASRYSRDAKDKNTSRNSQTVFNALLQPSLRWIGDRKSGAHQAERSLTGSMGFATAEDVVPLLQQFGYEEAFKKAFPKDNIPISPTNYALAIQVYEETLVTPSAFDRYLKGDGDALSVLQKEGLELFIGVGCADCHNGPLLGGNSIQKFGIHKDYASATKSERHDAGVFETSKNESDRDHFRVSMLRNIAKTGPYFHDGSVEELHSAIRIMAEVQLDKKLSEPEVKSIASFLGSLTGDLPLNYSPTWQRAQTD